MDDIKIRVIDSKKLIEAINTGSYEINLSAVMALGAVVTQFTSQWIPCTPETMPQEDGEYLVTIHWESGGYYTDLLIYKAYLKEWKNEDRIFGTVIAWQPKPEPYREGGQGG